MLRCCSSLHNNKSAALLALRAATTATTATAATAATAAIVHLSPAFTTSAGTPAPSGRAEQPRQAELCWLSAMAALKYKLHFDGGARAVSGSTKAGCGFVVSSDSNEVLERHWHALPDGATNNEAEYKGLIFGLQRCKHLGLQRVAVFGDSNLVINQVFGRWKTKASNLKQLTAHAKALTKNFKEIKGSWIPRGENHEADALANRAMDERRSGAQVVSAIPSATPAATPAVPKPPNPDAAAQTRTQPTKGSGPAAGQAPPTKRSKHTAPQQPARALSTSLVAATAHADTSEAIHSLYDPLIADAEKYLATLYSRRDAALEALHQQGTNASAHGAS